MRTVQQLYDDKRDKVIIDIRDKEEYDKETMDSAVQYFWEDMMNDLKMDNISGREKFLNTYSKKVPIYLLCYSGQKSEELEDTLEQMGYEAYSIDVVRILCLWRSSFRNLKDMERITLTLFFLL